MEGEAAADESYGDDPEWQMLWEGMTGSALGAGAAVVSAGGGVTPAAEVDCISGEGSGSSACGAAGRDRQGWAGESKVLPEKVVGMLEAVRRARRLMGPGWRGEKGQGRW